VFKGLRS